MEEYLEKRAYVYRRSYKYYSHISTFLTVNKFIFSASGLTAFVILPLAALSLGVGVIEVIDKALNISERKQDFKMGFKFYRQLLSMFKAKEISESEIYMKEMVFIENLKYLPREKYIKDMNLNGYK